MRLHTLSCLAALTALVSPAAAQTGVLDQDNTATTNIAEALGFEPFVYEQVVEVGITGNLEGFVIRTVETNAPSPTLPFCTLTFVDTSAAALNFDVGHYFLIQVGDAVIDLTGWDLSLNEGFHETLGTFVAFYPHELFTDGNSEPLERLVFQSWITDAVEALFQ